MTPAVVHHHFFTIYFLLLLLLQSPEISNGQQTYVNNQQLACEQYQNSTNTLGFICNGAATSCNSYIAFRSTLTYNNPATIAFLLNADANEIAAVNNISAVNPLTEDTLLMIPITCNCFNRRFYQHNTSYILTHEAETYFTVSNDTYQALTTCQSMMAQNPNHPERDLYPNLTLAVPIRCACPTRNQTDAGFNYLLTYLIRQGNEINRIANAFSGAGATSQSILDANELSLGQIIYFFTPILVPLTREPTRANINTGSLPTIPPPSPPTIPPTTQSTRSNSRRWIFIGVGVGAGFLALCLLGFLFWRLSFRHKRHPSPPPKLFTTPEEYSRKSKVTAETISSDWSLSREGILSAVESLTVYKFDDLEKATGSFSEANQIKGSSVFRGSINGDNCAVKIMKGDVSREIGVLRQINHSHIIRLSGFCFHEGSTYLVYEFAMNGSLSDRLKPTEEIGKHTEKYTISSLDWKQRVQIAYDVADALNYLHNFTNPPYIHNNLKSSNVLLDGNMRAKVANFGLARNFDENDDEAVLTRHVVGTYGYMAPEYIENGLVTPKLDVFALGVLILELLSGKESVLDVAKDKEGNGELLLYEVIEVVLGGDNVREKLREFMDPSLEEEYPLELAYNMAQLARSCVESNLNARPIVSEVFMSLGKILSSSLDWDPSHELESSASFSLSDFKEDDKAYSRNL